MKGIIYEYYNASTNMYYIGQTRDRLAKRDWSHRKGKGTNSYFDNAYHKYPEQFSLKILVEINLNSKELLIKTLNLLEITYIRHYKFLKRKLYNISKGGNLSLQGITPTPKMLKALEEGRINNNNKLKANKFFKKKKLKKDIEYNLKCTLSITLKNIKKFILNLMLKEKNIKDSGI